MYLWNTHEIHTLKARVSASTFSSLPVPRGECGPTSSGFLALRLVVSLPGGQIGVGERRWVSPPRSLQAASGWPTLLCRWLLCPLSLLHLCVLAAASFSSPKGEGRSGSLAFTSLGCTCGFHTSLSCHCLKTKHHLV